MAMLQHLDGLLIVDYGSQYTQLIARRIRELGVYCEVYPHDISLETLRILQPKGIILSGGPDSVSDDDALAFNRALLAINCPVLAICYGMQLLVHDKNGHVECSSQHEYGQSLITLDSVDDPLWPHAAGQSWYVWMSHGDRVLSLPDHCHSLAHSDNGTIAAIKFDDAPIYGLQFHPEVHETQYGSQILKQFATQICGQEANWTSTNIIDEEVARIQQKVGKGQVLLALSGGVDSAVAARLLHRALQDQLVCVFVDTGLLREGEAQKVMSTFDKHLGIHVIQVDAKQRFMEGLQGVADPEAKRHIIGHLFIDIFVEQAEKLANVQWLGQGTIYPDVIESANSGPYSHLIKSHHNVGGLPDYLQLPLIEPLRRLFKDEVREIGVQLGLPDSMVYRHPFPGPGLAVRILGQVQPEYVKILQKADAIFIDLLVESGWYQHVSQAFATFLPIKTVCVKGDRRGYDYVIGLRAVETVDYMTARWAHLPYDLIHQVSRRIMNEVEGVSRVVYDVSDKPPATIEWE